MEHRDQISFEKSKCKETVMQSQAVTFLQKLANPAYNVLRSCTCCIIGVHTTDTDGQFEIPLRDIRL